jgi:hypothetical protein
MLVALFYNLTMYRARLMFLKQLGRLSQTDYGYFSKIGEPEIYFICLGKKPLAFWKEEFKDLELSIETELTHVISLVKRTDENEVIIGIRLEDF